MRNGVLMHMQHLKRGGEEGVVEQTYIPVLMRRDMVLEFHDGFTSGHLGFDRTYKRMQDRVYWRGMHADVEAWVKPCIKCGSGKAPSHTLTHAPTGTLPIPLHPLKCFLWTLWDPCKQPSVETNTY